MLPDPATDARSDTTALAIAIGGAICPVPFVMPAAAIRIARAPRRSRRATVALVLAWLTIVAQVALAALVARLVLS